MPHGHRHRLSAWRKKHLAAAVAVLAIALFLTSPAYHSGRPGIGVNGTSGYHDDYYDDYYDLYYGNATAVPAESWVEFHSPLDWMGYYYCTNRTALQVGVFVLGFVGEGGIVPEEGDGNHPADAGGNAPGEGGAASENGDGNPSAAGPDGNASLAKTPDCFGIISPIPATGELDPYGHGWNVCYGFRVAESMDCAY